MTKNTTNTTNDTDVVERVILEALDALWSARHAMHGWSDSLDEAVIDELLPFGESAAIYAIKRHRSQSPIHRRAPDINAMVAIARQAAIGSRARSRAVVGGWRPPEDKPEDIARSKRIEEWSRCLDDDTVNKLTDLAVKMRLCPRSMMERVRRRDGAMAMAVLAEAARRVDASMLPLSLREDVDTAATSVKARRR